MKNMNQVDVLFVGAGPANLAAAITLKRLLKNDNMGASVVVIEKSDKPGQHNLSGAVFEADVLEELMPGWKESQDPFITKLLTNKVEKDEIYFLTAGSAMLIPENLAPAAMHHKDNYTLSLSEMVNWMMRTASGLGVEVYNGFAAKDLIIENGAVRGVVLGEKGRGRTGEELCNYIPGESIGANVTVLGEGSLGQLSEKLVQTFDLARDKNVPIHSVGVKEVIRLPESNNFGPKRVIHTLGYPIPSQTFGGGTIYSMSENTVAVAIVLALDWKYCDLNPHQELQVFKAHKFISKLLEGGEVVAYGAKTLPEGGYYALPELVTDGAIIVGDAAGFTNPRKLKGLHYAIKSGMVAGEAVFAAVKKGSYAASDFRRYSELLKNSYVMQDLYRARNYRQVFNTPLGLYMGLPLSFVQQALPRFKTRYDYRGMNRAKLNRQYNGGIDRLTDVSLSGTIHSEDEPSHITFKDERQCHSCAEKFGCHPCEFFCPGEVYRFEDDELILSPSNCLHCQTCRVKCPEQNIQWQVPEGGDGPKYKVM